MPIGVDTTQGDEERPRLHRTGVFSDMIDLTARQERRGRRRSIGNTV